MSLISTFKFDSDDFDNLMPPGSLTHFCESTAAVLKKIDRHLEAFRLDVSDDMDRAFCSLDTLQASVGFKPSGYSNENSLSGLTVWDGLLSLQDAIEQLQRTNVLTSDKLTDFNTILTSTKTTQSQSDQRFLALKRDYDSMSSQVQDITSLVQLLNQEQKDLIHALQSGVFQSDGSPSDLNTRLQQLESNYLPFTQGGSLTDISRKLQQIEAKLGDYPVRLGDIIFNSLQDVKVFVEEHDSGLSFSLFHDAVTLLESLTDVYVEPKEIILEWFQASRVGLSDRLKQTMLPLSSSYYPLFWALPVMTNPHPTTL